MKYKIGDEVLVKARINSVSNIGTGLPYEVKEIDNKEDRPRTIWVSEQYIQEVPDMTAEEAWEIAKKILLYPAHGGFNATELEEIFGRTEHLWELTPQQAKAKIEAWEAEKEIKVGDVVKVGCYTGLVVSDDHMDDSYDILFSDGGTSKINIKDLKKTGRHIDIDGLLNHIRGDD